LFNFSFILLSACVYKHGSSGVKKRFCESLYSMSIQTVGQSAFRTV